MLPVRTNFLIYRPRGSVMSAVFGLLRVLIPSLIIFWILIISFHWNHDKPSHTMLRTASGRGDNVGNSISFNDIQPFKSADRPNHAIIVAGHAVMKLDQLAVADKLDDAWYLLPYQLDQGFPDIIDSHIKAGIDAAEMDSQSVLLFSGGQTRKDVGPTSEAASYYYLAQHQKWMSSALKTRVFLEEFARDSYENLLFSICRFKEATGYYPTKITVVGFDFKQNRFESVHRRAIKFPVDSFDYIGLRPENTNFDHNKAANGESSAVRAFEEDVYGCNDQSLNHKRVARNPFRRTIPYSAACPELSNLLNWCGPELFPGDLPWSLN